ncbi:lysophospholipase L1-like esterase [Chryseobacterium ginsenosidimutans]|uniref:rhamnogalacturonan acetylesterase n=1 Tax=Chryseobacterium ginsenosidimutans TaxID=687846 RepID=UPI0021698119|nr:rhamnogalacturonan acetylesterase [Chryseobacterium ginsenosidimutans]MCS3868307.1 lysophospholipase L1-like esterase [Chryseobacterium ginsenosidimutans]
MTKKIYHIVSFLSVVLLLTACESQNNAQKGTTKQNKKVTHIYLIGDSTMADYTGNYEPGKDYMKVRYPITGWGQVFQPFFAKDSLASLKPAITTDSVAIIDRAHGGRSTRTFFQEGRWRYVYEHLQPNDYVFIQFGHNDGSEKNPERYVNIEGYKEFLRLFVSQTRQKGGNPVILTPVARNYPWKDGKLENVHGEYAQAPIDIAKEMNVPYIDLNKLSMEYFTKKGQDFTTNHYFMNLPENVYEAYPKGQKDNTHFQPDGAKVVASIVYQEFKKLIKTQKK